MGKSLAAQGKATPAHVATFEIAVAGESDFATVIIWFEQQGHEKFKIQDASRWPRTVVYNIDETQSTKVFLQILHWRRDKVLVGCNINSAF